MAIHAGLLRVSLTGASTRATMCARAADFGPCLGGAMRVRHSLIGFCFLGLSACNLAVVGGTSGGTSGGTGNSGAVSPDYAANGFTATENNAYTVINVIEMDTGDVVQSNRAQYPTTFNLVYDPVNGQLTVYSLGQAQDNTVDAESQTFAGFNFGAGSPNFARVSTGDWTYMVYGMIDQNNGIYRHVFATAGGLLYDLPSTGAGVFTGLFGGVVERYDGTVSNVYPVIGDGTYTVDFQDGSSSLLITLDPARSNGVSATIAGVSSTGSSLVNNDYDGYANANLVTPTGTGYVEGDYAGFVAGPFSEETAGTVMLQSLGSPAVVYSLIGGYRGDE